MLIQGMPNQPEMRMAVIGKGDGEVRAVTQRGAPNIVLQVVGPLTALTVRAAHTFLVGFSGALTVSATGLLDIDGLHGAAYLGLSVAFVDTVKNLITIFSGLAAKYPLMSGEV